LVPRKEVFNYAHGFHNDFNHATFANEFVRRMKLVAFVIFTTLLSPACLYAQSENSEDSDVVSLAEDTECAPESDDCDTGKALSYEDDATEDTEDVNTEDTSFKSVEADLATGNTLKPAIFPIDPIDSRLMHFYQFKDRVQEASGLRWNVDYSILMQHASFTESGEDTASSSVFRILGTWLRVGDRDKAYGHLVWKVETRNPIFGNPTPRDMGFDTGSALSTANYKELDYWGITDLYWAQRFNGGRHAFLVGHMDAGDWADQYPLLNAWTAFISDAFYNNPTIATPKRGFGIVGQTILADKLYLMGGVHDANGKDGKLDFSSFWDTGELFKWAEFGHRGSENNVSARHNVHLNYWHQDEREETMVDKSWGLAFTYSTIGHRGNVGFIRAGYSRGGAAQMRRFIGVGGSLKVFGRDNLGVAVSWGSPPDKTLRDQFTGEVFYRVQLTQNLTFTPNFQWTFHPSLTLDTRWVLIPGLRMRLVF